MYEKLYETSFFNLPDQTVYYDLSNKIDLRPKLKNAYLKAITTTTGGAGTAGYALVPISVDNMVVDQSIKYTPVKNSFKRVTNKGMYAEFNVITAKGNAECYAEGDNTFTDADPTPERVSVPIKFLRIKGSVSGQAMAAIPSYQIIGSELTGTGLGGEANVAQATAINALQFNVMLSMRSFAEHEEKILIYGNKTTSYTGVANGLEFDGFATQLDGINQTDGTGLTLTESMMNKCIVDAVLDGGRPDIAICDFSTYNDIIAILSEKKIITTSMETTDYGTTRINWLGPSGLVRIIPSQFMDTTSGKKAIYFLQRDMWEVRVLLDTTYQDLAIIGDSREYFLKEYITLICRAPNFNSSIINLA